MRSGWNLRDAGAWGSEEHGIGEVGRGAGTPRIRAARGSSSPQALSLPRPSLSSGSSFLLWLLLSGPAPAQGPRPSRERAWPHGRLRAGALRPSVRWCLRRIARAGVILAARPLRRARVAPILVTLHKLEVVRLWAANEVLLVEAQHPRLRCQRRRGGRAGLGRACRARVPSGSSPVLAAYGAAAWPTFNTQAVPALAGCRCRRTCACRAGMGQSACTG